MPERKDLSLYDEMSTRGYEASVVGTFNSSFAFYERVLLRRLQAVGCRYNLVLTDAVQCGHTFTLADDLPELAGADYGLVPVRANRAFHPKFLLMLGRTKARLVVGSHNLTVCGFGLNREVTTAFDIDPSGPSVAIARQVWRFVQAWTNDLPESVSELTAACYQVAPWLQWTPADEADGPLLWTGAGRPSLWTQVQAHLQQPVHRMSVMSPYADANCAFLRRAVRELAPSELLVAIDPKTSEFPAAGKRLLPTARFVDVSTFGEGPGKRLHAKLYRFEFQNGGSLVLTGSANASAAAWLSEGSTGNAEMMVVHTNGDQVWRGLGLERLTRLPVVSDEAWRDIRARQQARAQDEIETGGAALFHASVRSDGFAAPAPFLAGVRSPTVEILGGLDVLATLTPEAPRHGLIFCPCNAAQVLDRATLLRVRLPRRTERFAILNRVDALSEKAAGTLRQNFRRALSSLQGDPEQITELMKLVTKAIFDQPLTLREDEPEGTRRTGAGKGSDQEHEPATLMVSARDTVKGRRRRLLAASSDLAVVIDALIYRLGQGLHREDTDTKASVRTREAGEENGDDDTGPEDEGQRNAALAKLCRSKINHLFKRMSQQFDAAKERGTQFTSAIVQLAAVLGIVKHLRRSKIDWVPRGDALVDEDKAWEFFKTACRALYAPSYGLAEKALEENSGRLFDELTIVRGLLAWLAFDCDVNVETLAHDLKEHPDDAFEYLVGVACLLPVATDCAHDSHASALLVHTLSSQPDDAARGERHLTWAERIDTAVSTSATIASGPFKLGDIVVPFKAKSPRPFVVSEVLHGKTGVVDIDRLGHKYFVDGWLAPIHMAERASGGVALKDPTAP